MWRLGGACRRRTLQHSPLTGAVAQRGARPNSCYVLSGSISLESGCLEVQHPLSCGKLHLRLNTSVRPIANKYREGKLQRTLKREFKST
ncbi:hypothetical protein JTE90_026915 [Oedothorax gibbosus]|uniref:Uncharacterized protein n=1 Tax=Oedothorax gibbosus TaxID=931172 RepID=A0AAV6TCQ2_9ARAC|nr:hypothetical protein JTE90_026915 [Oedothorax gibbosus]